ncbi:Cytochrome p450 protein [Emericellopsis cladophorae]|uniref:Cytochrome p450 protein n=1 Tax=Emericellopsis cladophorae TaxID=2686198 RepID=A0A9P9XVA0_9HYPO|nr:Cytochrome p450 protein [Emericellopsis cladophorae]KAI6778466.1 Cytochrome p450 protein [Emericellopsis cladophorae]
MTVSSSSSMDHPQLATTNSDLPTTILATVASTHNILLLVLFFFLAYLLKCIYALFIYPYHVSPLRHLPTPKENHHWLLGQMITLLSTPWMPYLYREWSRDCPDAPFLRILKIGQSETLIPNTITAYREVLQTKNDCFVKSEESRNGAAMVIGDGLPWAHGDDHRARRAVLNKLFAPQRMKACVPKIKAKAEQLCRTLAAKQSVPGDAVTVETELWKAVLDVGGIKSMGVDLDHLGSDASPLHEIFSATMRPSIRGHIERWTVTHLPFKQYLPLEAFSEFVRKCATARSVIRKHVQARRRAVNRGEKARDDADVLQAMVEATGLWDDEQVVEYILNFMVLGHDTTACTLVWALDTLARRQDIQDRLRKEINEMEEQSWAEIDRAHFLENFMREVLRVHCPVGWIPMVAACDVEISGVLVPKNTTLNLCPAMVNLKPEIWGPDAEEFDPDRWDRLEGEAGSAYAFATFHNGPRVCIGKALTLMELKMVIVELVSQFKMETDMEPLGLETPSFTLKPKQTLQLRLFDA